MVGSCEIARRWMQMDMTDDKSTLILVMTWCHQTPIHYLGQFWPRSMSPYGHNELIRKKLSCYSHCKNVLSENIKAGQHLYLTEAWQHYIVSWNRVTMVQVMARCLIAASHNLNQCWLFFFNYILTNIYQWNFIPILKFFIQESAFENVFCKMSAILFRLQQFYCLLSCALY